MYSASQLIDRGCGAIARPSEGGKGSRQTGRMIDFVETSSGQVSRYLECSKRGKGRYEVEHIWADPT